MILTCRCAVLEASVGLTVKRWCEGGREIVTVCWDNIDEGGMSKEYPCFNDSELCVRI